MNKKSNKTAAAAAAKAQEKKVTFNINEIGYTDLDGRHIGFPFDQKDFGNLVFSCSSSIEMDSVARAIHASGVSECRPEDANIIAAIVENNSAFTYRVKSAVRDYVNNLIKEDQ